MRTSALRLSALALGGVLALTGLSACGGDDGGGGDRGGTDGGAASGDTSAAAQERDPAEVLDAAADATLDARQFSIDSQAELDIDGSELVFGSEGAVDYDRAISDTTLSVEQGGETQSATILADGDRLWVSAEGSAVPAFPEGATYVEGDASLLSEDDDFSAAGLLGVVLVLHGGAEADPEAGDVGEVDGVETRTYSFTVRYDEAAAALDPEQQQAFTSALSLTGEADQADLVVEVEIGADDVVRHLSLDIEADVPVDGGYEVELGDVGEEVEPPDAPDEDEVATGPEAEAVLAQLLSS